MRSDPRIGLAVSLVVAGAALLWLLAQWMAGDEIWAVLGDATHAITLLSIFLLLSGLAVALLFRRYWRVKADLLAGRDVIARWRVEPDQFRAFSAVAIARDFADKRGALFLILFFVVVIFGAFALFDPEAAPAMLATGVALALVMVIAFFLGNRVQRRQMEPRSREVIVGTRGLMVNDVLHVWSAFLTWLSDVRFDRGPPPTLTITYAYLARFGPQFVNVMLPVPGDSTALGELVEDRLRQRIGGRPGRRRRRAPAKEPGGTRPATGSNARGGSQDDPPSADS